MFIQYFNMFYNILKVQRASFIRLVCFVFLEKYLKKVILSPLCVPLSSRFSLYKTLIPYIFTK